MLRCVAAGEISASGWTVPVSARSCPASGPPTATHNGVDIAVPKGTQVHAAAAGIVIVAKCNAHVGPVPYGCDRDGGIFVKGCGWYVDILHAGNVITRHCHMMVRPYVSVGPSCPPARSSVYRVHRETRPDRTCISRFTSPGRQR